MMSDGRTQEEALKGLLDPALTLTAPMSPEEQMREKYGTGGSLLRMLGVGLSGGLLGHALLPEIGPDAQKEYETKLETYNDQLKAQQVSKALSGIDPENLTPAHIALANEYGGSALGEYYTDQYAAQQNAGGGDSAIAEAFGYTPYQWSQLSPETKRDLRDKHAYQNGGEGAFDYRLQAEGKLPEQLQAGKEAEAKGTGYGQEIIKDRGTITGIRNQYRQMQQGIDQTQMVRDLIANKQADPGKFRAGIRKAFGVETYEDGTMSAVAAQGVIDQIKQATFGAISEKELEMLYDGLINPAGSPESNMGRLDVALDRMRSQQEGLLGEAKLAWDRLSGHEDQADFLSAVSDDDWAYLNLGEGSKLKPIHMMVDGKQKTVTFSEYYKARKEAAGPYEDLSREQIVIDYRKAREAEKELWEKQQKVKADLQEEARRALELEFME